MSDIADSIVDVQRQEPTVLPQRERTFRQLCVDANVPAIRVHDHSCATRLFTMCAQPAIVQRILRHSSITVTTGTYVEVIEAVAARRARFDGQRIQRGTPRAARDLTSCLTPDPYARTLLRTHAIVEQCRLSSPSHCSSGAATRFKPQLPSLLSSTAASAASNHIRNARNACPNRVELRGHEPLPEVARSCRNADLHHAKRRQIGEKPGEYANGVDGVIKTYRFVGESAPGAAHGP